MYSNETTLIHIKILYSCFFLSCVNIWYKVHTLFNSLIVPKNTDYEYCFFKLKNVYKKLKYFTVQNINKYIYIFTFREKIVIQNFRMKAHTQKVQ